MKNLLLTGVAVVAATASSPSFAAQLVDFSYSRAGVTASGTFTITDTTVNVGGRNAFSVTGVTGSRNGVAITGPQPLFPTDFGGGDQFLFLTGEKFTSFGVSFGLADGSFANLFDNANGVVAPIEYFANNITGNGTSSGVAISFTLGAIRPAEPVTGAVPEPATWAMMIAGFGLVGGAMRRRRVSAAIRFA